MAGSALALDVGARRVGVAIASLEVRLPRPLITLPRDDSALWAGLATTVEVEQVKVLVVGFPRGLHGQHTRQTEAIEQFVLELKQHFPLPVHMQDEALTSKHAEAELEARGKLYSKEDIDALAATYILEDWLSEHKEMEVDEAL
jgi:putative Holliday junction resolvase